MQEGLEGSLPGSMQVPKGKKHISNMVKDCVLRIAIIVGLKLHRRVSLTSRCSAQVVKDGLASIISYSTL